MAITSLRVVVGVPHMLLHEVFGIDLGKIVLLVLGSTTNVCCFCLEIYLRLSSKSPKCRLQIPCGCLGCEARQCNSCAAKLRSVPQNIVSGGVPAPLFCANSPNILPDSPERIICCETTLGGFVSVKSHVVKMNQKRNKHATPYLGVQTI